MLFLLTKSKNALLEREFALNAIWGDANYFNGRSMDVYIAKLRKHLKEDDQGRNPQCPREGLQVDCRLSRALLLGKLTDGFHRPLAGFTLVSPFRTA